MRKTYINIILILLLSIESVAQQKYWIYFKDKAPSEAVLKADFYDLPVSSQYIDSLVAMSYQIVQQSKWLNAVSVFADHEVHTLERLDFVDKVQPVNQDLKVLAYNSSSADMSLALKQLHADTLIRLGWHGKGVKIGIIDGGFLEANKEDALLSLTNKLEDKHYQNFIEKDIQNPFAGAKRYSDDHGTIVWKLIAGYSTDKNKHYGLASASTYYLARTDQGDKEYRGEEDYWIAALEWMHDQGVRLINSSLGYSNGYDNPKENYHPRQVDGQSSAITQAANIAAGEKGMILVIAAGNDGANNFGVISIPADAEGILAVGATDYLHWERQGYSSIGPAHLPYVKPEVSCYSAQGTSFSAPVITGLIASILQGHPQLTNDEVVELIKKSSHLYPYPNNYLGYGVPDVRKMLWILDQQEGYSVYSEISTTSDSVELSMAGMNTVIFHKSNETQVISQEIGKPRRNKLTVKRTDNANFTTVATPEQVIEIKWQ